MWLCSSRLIMSIHAHKTGLVKTLGQQSDAIVTSDLIGNFVPSLGIATTHWTNQAASNALRRFNSIAHNNSAPHNFQFDGTNDYLGQASTGYGGTAFTINIANAYTLGCWWKHKAGGHNNVFSLGDYTSGGMMLFIRGGSGVELYVNNQGTVNVALPKGNDKWYYLSVVHDGSNNYTVFIDGSYAVSLTKTGATGTQNLELGRFYDGSSYTYSANESKVGHIHVHSVALKNSRIRQNMLASHDINDARIYGATYAA